MRKKVWLGLVLGLVAMLFVGVSINSGCGQVTSGGGGPTYGTGTITGQVLTATGTPVANATVYTFNGTNVLSATTSTSGQYSITGVWIGLHVLLITSDNYYAIITVAVSQDATTTQNITVEAGSAGTASPTISLTSTSTQTASEFFMVAGTVTPTGEVPNVIISVNNNDTIASVSSGLFGKVVRLAPGDNTIVVTAVNSRGLSQKTITVTYNPPASQTGTVKITLNWDKKADIDLHLWNRAGDKHTYYGRHYGGPLDLVTVEVINVLGTMEVKTWNKDTSEHALPHTLLDYDNIGGTGPENITIFQEGLTQEARYLVGVNGYSGSLYPVTCSLSVKLPDGTTHAYTSVINASNGNSGNPNADTTHWWRPFDIVVSSAGVVSIAPATNEGTPITYSVGSNAPIIETRSK